MGTSDGSLKRFPDLGNVTDAVQPCVRLFSLRVVHARVCVCTRVHICTCMYTCTLTRAHARAHTHIQPSRPRWGRRRRASSYRRAIAPVLALSGSSDSRTCATYSRAPSLSGDSRCGPDAVALPFAGYCRWEPAEGRRAVSTATFRDAARRCCVGMLRGSAA